MADGITLADLLEDAATCLDETKKPALARASRMAAAIVSDEPHGESWIADVLQVLSEAEDVVITARANQESEEPIILDGLATALDACADWGLTPDQRMISAYNRILHELATLRATLGESRSESATVRMAHARRTVDGLLDALGFGEKPSNSDPETDEDKHE